MKTCSYCGKEYPDDAVVCMIDQSPLVISKPRTLTDSSNSPKKYQPFMARSILSVGGFAVLAGLSGFGLTWLVVRFPAKGIFKNVNDQLDFAAKSMPILIAGGIVGFFVGLVVSLNVVKADPKTEEEIEKKYVGLSGRVKIFFGCSRFRYSLARALF